MTDGKEEAVNRRFELEQAPVVNKIWTGRRFRNGNVKDKKAASEPVMFCIWCGSRCSERNYCNDYCAEQNDMVENCRHANCTSSGNCLLKSGGFNSPEWAWDGKE